MNCMDEQMSDTGSGEPLVFQVIYKT